MKHLKILWSVLLGGALSCSIAGSIPWSPAPARVLAASRLASRSILLPPALAPVPGQDLWHIDMDTGQFIQDTAGHVHLYLRDAPVGTPDTNGWRLRDPSLRKQPDGSFAPVSLPFGLDIAANTGAPSVATITNEGGVTLQIGLANLPGKLPPVPGRLAGSQVQYPSPTPKTTPDLAVQATDSGLSLHIRLHTVRQSSSVTLRLTLPDGVRLKPTNSGDIEVTRPITGYGDSGPTSVITIGPEYVIERPVVLDATSGITAVAQAAHASMSLGPLVGGTQDVTITPDPAWLQDRARRFPVTLTIPFATALAASETGIFTTVDSCAPARSWMPTDMLVGVAGTCVYQGWLSFMLPPMLPAPTITSATLGLYAPNHPTATGIKVYMNGPLSFPFVAPSVLDQTAPHLPPVVQGVSGVPESGSGSPWHIWDVTAIVRRWIEDWRANGGLTLRGEGSLVQFAWPVDAGSGTGQTAPLLHIVFG